MTDEDMAKSRATIFTDMYINEPDYCSTEKEIGYHAYYYGFLAGLSEGRARALSEAKSTFVIKEISEKEYYELINQYRAHLDVVYDPHNYNIIAFAHAFRGESYRYYRIVDTQQYSTGHNDNSE